jgi:NOL1/NOP2/fmu family ribosome biogenesis protein
MFWKSARVYGIVSKSVYTETLRSLKVYSMGMVLLRKVRQYIKPTTHALQIFGHLARKSIVDLDRETVLELLEYRVALVSLSIEPGYVILAYQGDVLGCGLVLPDCLLHQFPRWMVSTLTAALKAFPPSPPSPY